VQQQPRDCNKVEHALAAVGGVGNVVDDPVLEIRPPCMQSGDFSAYE
jgi:hypothetical protein